MKYVCELWAWLVRIEKMARPCDRLGESKGDGVGESKASSGIIMGKIASLCSSLFFHLTLSIPLFSFKSLLGTHQP